MSSIPMWFNLFGGGSGSPSGVLRGIVASGGVLMITASDNGTPEKYTDYVYYYDEETFEKTNRYQDINTANGESRVYTKTFELKLVTELRNASDEVILSVTVSNFKVTDITDKYGKTVYTDEWRTEWERITQGFDPDAVAIAWAIATNAANESAFEEIIKTYDDALDDFPDGKRIPGVMQPTSPTMSGDGDNPFNPEDGMYAKTTPLRLTALDPQWRYREYIVHFYVDMSYENVQDFLRWQGRLAGTIESTDGEISMSFYALNGGFGDGRFNYIHYHKDGDNWEADSYISQMQITSSGVYNTRVSTSSQTQTALWINMNLRKSDGTSLSSQERNAIASAISNSALYSNIPFENT